MAQSLALGQLIDKNNEPFMKHRNMKRNNLKRGMVGHSLDFNTL